MKRLRLKSIIKHSGGDLPTRTWLSTSWGTVRVPAWFADRLYQHMTRKQRKAGLL